MPGLVMSLATAAVQQGPGEGALGGDTISYYCPSHQLELLLLSSLRAAYNFKQVDSASTYTPGSTASIPPPFFSFPILLHLSSQPSYQRHATTPLRARVYTYTHHRKTHTPVVHSILLSNQNSECGLLKSKGLG